MHVGVAVWLALWLTALAFLGVRHLSRNGLPKRRKTEKKANPEEARIRTIQEIADQIRRDYEDRIKVAQQIGNEEIRKLFIGDIEERYMRQMRQLLA